MKANPWMAYNGRKIIVGEEWLDGGGSALMGREFYPYLTAMSHAFFGQSNFAQRIFDVWSVLCVTTLLAKFAIQLKLNIFISFYFHIFT